MNRTRFPRPRPRPAQALVEFALIAIVFFLIVMGIFDLGRIIYSNNMLSNAAREGARYGIISGRNAEQICTYAKSRVLLPGTVGCVATEGTPEDWDTGNYTPVQVTLTYDFQPITPLIGAIVGNAVTLRASSTMYVEQ